MRVLCKTKCIRGCHWRRFLRGGTRFYPKSCVGTHSWALVALCALGLCVTHAQLNPGMAQNIIDPLAALSFFWKSFSTVSGCSKCLTSIENLLNGSRIRRHLPPVVLCAKYAIAYPCYGTNHLPNSGTFSTFDVNITFHLCVPSRTFPNACISA